MSSGRLMIICICIYKNIEFQTQVSILKKDKCKRQVNFPEYLILQRVSPL